MNQAARPTPQIEQAMTDAQIAGATALFREYERWLDLDLCFQGFEAELASLPGKYSPPDGRLFLVRSGEHYAGCAALRKLDDGVAEMKRLYVRDQFRGQKIGLLMIRVIIEAAREIGYRKLRLDTYPPKMGKAVSMYESHGFSFIDPYYDNPHADTVFMELVL